MRDEYQIGPHCADTKVTGRPSLRPERGVEMNDSYVSLRSTPIRTPLTRSALSVEAGQPTACAISLSVQRRMQYSSESCIKHITLIQTPFSAFVERRKLLFACQSAG